MPEPTLSELLLERVDQAHKHLEKAQGGLKQIMAELPLKGQYTIQDCKEFQRKLNTARIAIYDARVILSI